MKKLISSSQNPTIKKLLHLQEKSRIRKKEGLFVVEGVREMQLAYDGGYKFEDVFVREGAEDSKNVQDLLKLIRVTPTFLSAAVYEKVAYRGGTEGVIAFAKAKHHPLKSLDLPENPLILVAEAPEKPGNIGALLRTADAAGVDAFLLANPKTDLYNPNIIRSSVGCVFTTTIGLGTTSEIIDFLNTKGIAMYSAILQEAVAYQTVDYTTPSAMVVGTEATGLSEAWRVASTKNVIIPMSGVIDSMNVSVAAGILIFEAKRQRGF